MTTNMDIVTALVEDIKGVIVAEVPSYTELDFVYNVNKNTWNSNKKRWGVTALQLFETSGVTSHYTVTQRFRVILTDEYSLVMSGDMNRRTKVNALMDKAHEIYTEYLETRNIQLSLNVSNLSFQEAQFIEASHVAIVTFEFDIKYRNPLHPKYSTFAFLDLSDTPNSYTGQEGKAVVVKEDASGVEFISIGELTGLTIDITTTAPLQGGALGTDAFTLSIPQAGVSQDGYLSSTDWNTFNNKQPAGDYILASELDGYQPVGDYALNSTLANYAQKSLLDGYQPAGSYQPAGDYALNSSLANYAEKTLLDGYQPTGDYALASQLDGYQPVGNYALKTDLDGYQPAGDYALNSTLDSYALKTLLDGYQIAGSYAVTTRNINTSAPLSGGGDLSADRTLAISQAGPVSDGYLSSNDWTTFINKSNYNSPLTTTGDMLYYNSGDTRLPIGPDGYYLSVTGGVPTWAELVIPPSGVTDVTASAPLSSSGGATPNLTITQASASADGYLSSTDWTTFNGKQDTLSLGDLTETISAILTITGGSGATIGNVTIEVKQAGATQDGFLGMGDWTTFNSKQDSLVFGDLTETTSSVLTISGNTGAVIGTGLTIQVKQASGSQDGYLSSTDWTTFNNKQPAGDYALASQLDGYQPVGDYALNSTLANYAQKTLLDGYQVAGDYALASQLDGYQPVGDYALNSTLSSYALKTLLDGYQVAGDYALASQLDGYQPVGDYALNSTLDGYAIKTRTISTNAPLSGGGDLTADRTLSISKASAISDGYLSSVDWTTFNGKQAALGFTPANSTTTISTTSPLSGGGDLSANRTLSISQANGSTSGYLSSTDWTTFNNKQAALGYTPVNRAGDTMTGALDLGSFKITSLANGTNPTDAVNYSQLTSLATGLNWQDPVLDPDVVDDSLSAPPGSPTTSATYIIGASATGAWTGHEGKVVWYDGSNWIDVSTGNVLTTGQGTAVAIGDRFLVASATSGLGGLLGGNFSGQQYKIAVVTNATPGSYAYTFSSPVNAWALSVSGIGSNHTASSFTYSSTLTRWVNFSGPSQVGVGDGLVLVGNTINVKYDDSTIATNGSNQLYVKAGGITNTQISATAAISYGKLALSNSIVNADIATTAAIAYSKLNLSGSILTGDLATGFVLPSSQGGTGVSNNGSLTYGSNNITLTTSGTTSLTLPTSGTLVTESRSISTTAPLSGGGDLSNNRTLSISQAGASTDGYLSSTDWNTFNNKQPAGSYAITTRSISTTAPLTGGGDLSADRTLSIPKATSILDGYLSSADWSTFNSKQAALTLGNLTETTSSVLTITGGTGATVGNVTIEVKQASGSQSGFLSSTDWTTFNNKQNALGFTPANSTTTISTTAPLSGGGDLSANRTLSIPKSSSIADGYLSSTDWSTFNGKQNALTLGNLTETTSSVLTITGGTGATVGNVTIEVKQASGSQSGFLSSTDWTTFNNKSSYTDPLTTRGDILIRNASNVTARLPIGANTYVLTSDGTDVSWAAPTGGGTGDINNGGNTTGANITIGTNDAFNLLLETNATTRLTITQADITSTLPVLGPNGSVTAPTIAFSTDPNTGIYSVGADQIGITTGGTNRLTISTTAATFDSSVAVVASNTTESTSSTTGALRSSGGIAAAKNIVAGGQIASTFHDAGNSGASVTIDWNNGNVQELNISAATAISFSNPIDGATYVLIMIQDSNYTRTWGSTIKWAAGAEPTWSTVAGRIDILTLLYANGTWYGGADTAFS